MQKKVYSTVAGCSPKKSRSATEKAHSIEKLRWVVLSVIVAGFLFSALGYLVVCAINPALAPPSRLPLDNRKTNQFAELTVQTVASGNFQDSFEKAAADHIFCRDEILQVNAGVQRIGIRTSNLLFNFPAFSTYYGSGSVEMPQVDRIQKKPSMQSETKEKRMQANADALNNLTSKIEGKLIYYKCSRIDSSACSPASKLVNTMADEEYVQQVFADRLDSRWQFLSGEYETIQDFDQDYFRLDHHWKISGATKAYKRIMQILDRESVDFSEPRSAGWPTWQGSFARLGIDFSLEGEQLEDVDYARSALSVTADGKEREEDFLDRGYAGSESSSYQPEENYQDYYDSYFHKRVGILIMTNTTVDGVEDGVANATDGESGAVEGGAAADGVVDVADGAGDDAVGGTEEAAATGDAAGATSKNDDTLLILADSFSSCMDRFFAESYKRVIVVDPRKFDGSLSEVINEYSPKDCVCIFSDPTIWDSDNGVPEALSS